jgi:hypothetical protein
MYFPCPLIYLLCTILLKPLSIFSPKSRWSVEMKQPVTSPQATTATVPQQVWASLTRVQQKAVLQTLVQMCRQISEQSQEKKDESAADR